MTREIYKCCINKTFHYTFFLSMYKFVIWNVSTTSPLPNKLIYILQHWTLRYFLSNTHAQTQFLNEGPKFAKYHKQLFLTKCLLIRCNEWSKALHHLITNLLGNYFELPKSMVKGEFLITSCSTLFIHDFLVTQVSSTWFLIYFMILIIIIHPWLFGNI
jgi:hypothetical protein